MAGPQPAGPSAGPAASDPTQARDYWRLATRTALTSANALAALAYALDTAAEAYDKAAREATAAATVARQGAALARKTLADADRWAAHATGRYCDEAARGAGPCKPR